MIIINNITLFAVTRDTPDLLRRPAFGAYGIMERASKLCGAKSQDFPQFAFTGGYGALPLPIYSYPAQPDRSHRSAPQVTFKDFDYDI